MQFLYPNVLWALFTLTIPIIIHLFNFRRYKTVYFSNVAFLKNIRKETKSRSNLKNLLILLSRMLALAFIVFVFAQPYIPSEKNAKVSENPYVAVYVDNSFSMEAEGKYGILLESAKVKAKELTSMFPRNTKYLLVTNEFLLLHQRFVSSEQFIDWVSQISTTHVVRNLGEVIDKISRLIPENDTINIKNVFLFTDFQKNTLKGKLTAHSGNLKFYGVPFFNETEGNLYIDSAWFETPGHYKGKQENFHVRIKNISNETYTEIPCQLFINDSIRSSVLINIEAFGTKDYVIPFTEWNSGNFNAFVEISDYPIVFDNKIFFDFEIKEKKSVLIINGNSAEKYLNVLFNDDENIQSTSLVISDIQFNIIKGYQTIILNELENLSSGLINEVVQYANEGGTLVFIPHSEGNLESYNQLFDKLNKVKYVEYIEQEGNVTDVDLQNELFKSVFSSDLVDVRYPQYKGFYVMELNKKANSKALFKAESENPLFIQMPFGKGQCYLSALPLNSKVTDFGIHPLFVPLFYNLVLYSSSPADIFYWIKPGSFAQVSQKNSADGSLAMVDKSNRKELKPKYNISHQNLLIYPEIDKLIAGHYSIMMGGVFQNYISYNFDRTESEITYYTMDEVKELFEGINETKIDIIDTNAKNLAKTIQQQSQGKPLSVLFLWLAVFALIIEMALLRFLK